jgi:uncharacterized iron-regulated membrane protein
MVDASRRRLDRAWVRRALGAAHRVIGLATAAFLAVAGLTGSLLAFYPELDRVLNPGLLVVTDRPGEADLDPLALRERVARAAPNVRVDFVPLDRAPGTAFAYIASPRAGTSVAPDDEYFLDPRTGELLGTRRWGDLSQGLVNLMSFVYRLHYSLALGEVGRVLMGIVALAWTIDCFIGLWLTFPSVGGRRGWWTRWASAWRLRWTRGHKLKVDLHRVGGLWPWAMLLVLAWSSVSLNLREVYHPVMGAFLPLEDVRASLPVREGAAEEPELGWFGGLARGRALMAEIARAEGFEVLDERWISYSAETGLFRYQVRSTRDISDRYPATRVWFDGETGAFAGFEAPTGGAAGNTVTTWLVSLHRAAVGGPPFQFFVSLVGIVVFVLSVTGILIWIGKRRAGRRVRARHAHVASVRWEIGRR